jgi:hypothetical protein
MREYIKPNLLRGCLSMRINVRVLKATESRRLDEVVKA